MRKRVDDALRSLPGDAPRRSRVPRPPLRLMTTTLWEYPSQHYDSNAAGAMQGDKSYAGATPSWVIWQLLQRYTRKDDVVLDPMCGSGTTLDVCRDLDRTGIGFDLVPFREDIQQADARELPLDDESVDFVFVDPPYSTHIDYSDDPRCIGKLDASVADADGSCAYYIAMEKVIAEIHRVLRPRRFMALYVSDSFRKQKNRRLFMPIGFELFSILREFFDPVDIICVVRHNAKLARGNWHKAAERENFFLRGFNYLFILKKT
ncbi:MAG: DNA methylase [Planctomycetota bacterium]|nr:MAG: DNA methylase [Planctomycetota bacterium]